MERVWLGVLAGITALAFGCLPAAAAGASVQPTTGVEPGVTIDEGSPAAKEYALALTQARRTGSTGSHASSSEAPFGAGIRPPSSPGGAAAPTRTRARQGGKRGTKSRAGAPTGREAGPSPPLPTAVLKSDRVASSGGSSLLALLGGGVAILVLGGLGGVILRRNRRPPSTA